MRRGLLATVAATTGVALPVFLVGALAVQIRAGLRFDSARLGEAVAAYFAVSAACSIPFGRLTETVGGVRVMRASALGAALVMVVMAVAVTGWWELTVALGCAGVTSSAAQPAANQYISKTVALNRQGTAFGIKQSAVPLASLLGGLAVPTIGLTVGWRWAFVGAAALAALAALALPAPAQTLSQRRAAQAEAPVAHPRGGAELAVFAAAFAVGLLATSTLGTFLVTSAVSSGIAKAAAGFLAAGASALGVVSRLLVGVLADRRGGRHFPTVAAMLTVGAAGYGLLAAGTGTATAALFVPGALIAYAAGWGWNGLFNFAVVRTHPGSPASATAVTQTGGRLGSVAGPLLFGLVVQHGSYQLAWALDALAALLAAGGMLLGRSILLRQRRAEPLPT